MNNKIHINLDKNIIKDRIIEEIYLVEKYKYIPEVDQVCILHKKKTRTVKTADLYNEKQIIYHIGQYKYKDEAANKFKYITEKIPNVTGKRTYDNFSIEKITRQVIEHNLTISSASKLAKSQFNLPVSTYAIWDWLGIMEINGDDYNYVEKKMIEQTSEHYSVDEVYDNGDGIIIITDPIKDTIVHTSLIDGSVKTADIIESFTELKTKLDGENKTAESITRDGSHLYVNSLFEVFPFVSLQICIFHLIKNLLKYFMDWQRDIRANIGNKDTANDLDLNGKSIKQYLFQKRNLFVKKYLNGEERKIVKSIIRFEPTFYDVRLQFLRLMRVFYAISLKEAFFRFNSFVTDEVVLKHLPKVVKILLKYNTKDELFTYLCYSQSIYKSIRTSNHTERVNRSFRKKQKSHYRIRRKDRREKMLKFMKYFHNVKSLNLFPNHKVVFISQGFT
jgi:hypothetical protein